MAPVQLTGAKPYTVQAHDTLFSIARKQLATRTVEDIAKLIPTLLAILYDQARPGD